MVKAGSFLLLFCIASAPAQAPTLQPRIDAAIADLAEPQKAHAAAEFLERLGPKALPALRAVLQAQHRLQEPDLRVCNTLYVLGRMGRGAVAALPDVRDVVDAERNDRQRQALWAMGQICAFAGEDERGSCADVVARHRRDADGLLCGLVRERLRLSTQPGVERLRFDLKTNYADLEVAAADHLAATLDQPLPERDELLELVQQALARELARDDLPWRDREVAAAPYLAAVLVAVRGVGSDLLVARGLLHHFDAFERRRGLVLLREADDLAPVERADMLSLLWDADADVAEYAVGTLLAWASNGVIGLAPLRHLAARPGDAAFQRRRREAADRIVAATPAAADLDAVLAGNAASGVPAAELFHLVLLGAEWCADDSCKRLLADAHDIVDATTIGAVRRLLANACAETRAAAWSWLACRGRALLAAWPEAEDEIGWLPIVIAYPATAGLTMELHAWMLAGADAKVAELRTALDGDASRLVLRAICELVRRGGDDLRGSVAMLRHLDESAWPRMLLPRRGSESPLVVAVDLTNEVHRAVAVGRALAGDAAWDAPELVTFVAAQRHLDKDAATAWLASHRDAAAARDLVTELEAVARARLGSEALALPVVK